MKFDRRSGWETALQIPALVALLALLGMGLGTLWAGNNKWTNVGPTGGNVGFLAIDPQNPGTVYAGTETGVFKSKDGGMSWSDSGLLGFTVNRLAIDPQNPSTLYALTACCASIPIYKSTDGGASWNPASTGLPRVCCNTLALDPQNPSILYAAGGVGGYMAPNIGILKSTDGGATWQSVNSGISFAWALAIDPQASGTVYAAGYASTGMVVSKSTDGGVNWSEIESGLPRGGSVGFGSLAIDPKNPSTAYIALYQGGVFKSPDGGKTWIEADFGLARSGNGITAVAVAIDPKTPSTLYATTQGSGVFKSTDGGANWNASNSGLSTWASSLAIDLLNPSMLYAATSAGAFKSTDAGANWTGFNSGLRATPIFSAAINPQNPNTIYAGSYGLLKSTDGGMNWGAPSSGTGFPGYWVVSLAIDPLNPRTIYAGTGGGECWSGGVFKSFDDGASWLDTQANVNCLPTIVMDPQTPSTVYVGTLDFGGVSKSTDSGRGWSAVNAGLPNGYFGAPAVTALAIDTHNPGTLYVGISGGTVFKSTNGASSWSPASSGLPASDVYALAVDPQNSNTVYAATGYGLFKSTDGGSIWKNLSPFSSTTVYAVSINPQDPSMIYAGTDTGVFQSPDFGESWTPIPGAPTHTRLLVLDPHNSDKLYAGGPAGLFAISFVAPVLLSLSGDGQGQGAIQHAGTIRIASATDPAVAGEYLTVYATGLLDGSLVAPQVTVGGKIAEITSFGIVPGYPGLNYINVRMPGGVAPGPAVPVRLTYFGRASNEVTIGAQ